MSPISVQRLISLFSSILDEGEKIVALGVFRKIPPVPTMMMTRGFATFFSQKMILAVSDQRMILFPVSGKGEGLTGKPMESVQFDDVSFHESCFFSTIVEIAITGEKHPLRLRFSGQMRSLGLDKYEFIGAVYRGKSSSK